MLHIVLVEDEHLFAKSVSSRLKRDGFDVTICTDLAQAHSHFAENTIADALLLDVRLPDGSGLDFLSTLRKSGNTIPVIVITAYGELDDAVLAMKLGANDYLKKPLDLDELGLMLAKVLETGRIK
jgi:two-component system response regulator AtoC